MREILEHVNARDPWIIEKEIVLNDSCFYKFYIFGCSENVYAVSTSLDYIKNIAKKVRDESSPVERRFRNVRCYDKGIEEFEACSFGYEKESLTKVVERSALYTLYEEEEFKRTVLSLWFGFRIKDMLLQEFVEECRLSFFKKVLKEKERRLEEIREIVSGRESEMRVEKAVIVDLALFLLMEKHYLRLLRKGCAPLPCKFLEIRENPLKASRTYTSKFFDNSTTGKERILYASGSVVSEPQACFLFPQQLKVKRWWSNVEVESTMLEKFSLKEYPLIIRASGLKYLSSRKFVASLVIDVQKNEWCRNVGLSVKNLCCVPLRRKGRYGFLDNLGCGVLVEAKK